MTKTAGQPPHKAAGPSFPAWAAPTLLLWAAVCVAVAVVYANAGSITGALLAVLDALAGATEPGWFRSILSIALFFFYAVVVIVAAAAWFALHVSTFLSGLKAGFDGTLSRRFVRSLKYFALFKLLDPISTIVLTVVYFVFVFLLGYLEIFLLQPAVGHAPVIGLLAILASLFVVGTITAALAYGLQSAVLGMSRGGRLPWFRAHVFGLFLVTLILYALFSYIGVPAVEQPGMPAAAPADHAALRATLVALACWLAPLPHLLLCYRVWRRHP